MRFEKTGEFLAMGWFALMIWTAGAPASVFFAVLGTINLIAVCRVRYRYYCEERAYQRAAATGER